MCVCVCRCVCVCVCVHACVHVLMYMKYFVFLLQNDKRLMVIKEFLAPNIHSFTDEEQRFMDEARMVMMLNHRNVVTAVELSQEEDSFSRPIDTLHLCMEYCEGGDLRQVGVALGMAVRGGAVGVVMRGGAVGVIGLVVWDGQ